MYVCTLLGRALPNGRPGGGSLRLIAVSPRKMECNHYKVRQYHLTNMDV